MTTDPATEAAQGTGATLTLRSVTKRFGAFTAVDDLDLTVEEGRFYALLGPSGCGKTTTLRMVAGLEEPTSGTIELDGRDIAHDKPYKRPVNTVFQNYALFPHLDIHENVAFGLRRRGVRDVKKQVHDMLELVELSGFEKRRHGQLSGGQQQRVALAPARWSTGRGCSCWTSRSVHWTSSCADRCRSSSSGSRTRSASPSSTSPTTRRRP
jgi:spermidine/putrescine transport system ATP-binding protein